MTEPLTAISSGSEKKFRRHDNEFDEIETLYGAGYRLKDPQG